MARTTARAQALALQAIAHDHISDLDNVTSKHTLDTKIDKVASPEMAQAAVEEIVQAKAETDPVAAHVQRLTGGVAVVEVEKALHTLASFLSLPVKGIDNRTGEIRTWDLGRNEVKDILNSVCFQAHRMLDKGNEYGSVHRLEKARDRLTEDQVALSEGNEINEQEARRNMERVDYLEMVVAGVKELQAVAERVYRERTGQDYKRPGLKPTVAKAKVTDAGARSQLLAEMAKRTKVEVAAPRGDVPFDMAVHSADDRSTLKGE